MERTLFYKTFSFRTIRLTSFRHTDNSKGIPCHYIARMTCGRGTVRALSGEELSLSSGDIFYLPMGLQYHSYWEIDEAVDRSVAWESYGFTHLPISADTRYAMQKLYPCAEALRWLDCLKEDPTVSPASVGYLYLFLARVLPQLRIAEADPKEALLRTALDYIGQHEGFTVPELSRACGISESGLYALFRNYAGTTPIDIKHQWIAERATVMLTTTDMTVETIASALGLCSSAYLRRILKKQTGRTPLQIRQGAKFL